MLPIFWLPFSFEFLEFNKLYLLFFLSWTGVFIWLLKEILEDKEISFYWNQLDSLVFFFIFLAIVSFFFSADKSSSLFGSYGRFNNGILTLFAFFGLYLLVRNNLKLKPQEKKAVTLRGIFNCLFFSSFLALFWTYLSLFGLWSKIPRFSQVAIFNPVSSFTEGLAVFLSLIIILVLSRLLVKSEIERLEKVFYIIFLVFALPLLFLFDVKPALFLLGLGLIFFIIFTLREKNFAQDSQKLLFPISLVLLALLFSFLSFPNLLFVLVKRSPILFNFPRELILSQRESWGIAIQTTFSGIKNFFFGSGIGTFLIDFAKFKSERMNQGILWQLRWDKAGNHLTETFATLGFLGGSLFLLILIWLLMVVILKKTETEGISWRSFLIGLAILPLFFFQNITLGSFFWLGLAIVANFGPRKEKIFSLTQSPAITLIFETLTIVLGFGLTLSYFFGIKFYLADHYYQKGFLEPDLDKKTSFFQKAIAFNPYQPYYQMALSQALLSKGRENLQNSSVDQKSLQDIFSSAIFFAKKTKEIAPRHILYQQNLANVYRDLIGLASGAEEWAEKGYKEALELEPKNPLFYIEIGKIKLRLKKFDEARESFNKALQLVPNLSMAKIQLALLLEEEGKIKEAILNFENLASEFPENSEIYFHLGRLYYNQEEIEKAIEKFQQAILLFPDYSNARFMLALAFEKKGELQKALKELEDVANLNPENQIVKTKIEELKGKLTQPKPESNQ